MRFALMEFFEALETYIIDTHSQGLKEVTGTRINREYFAYRSDVPDFGWSITDTASGLALAIKLPTLKACRDYLRALTPEDRAKIEQARSTEEYKKQCEKVFKHQMKGTLFDFDEAYNALNEIYEDIDQKSLFELTEAKKETEKSDDDVLDKITSWVKDFVNDPVLKPIINGSEKTEKKK